MAPLKVMVNTFFQENRIFLDPLSKCYIVAESILGLNRLPVILKETSYFYFVTSLACIYSLTLSLGITYITHHNEVVWIALCFEYMFCIVFSFISWKRTDKYYNEINKFDAEIGCRPKATKQSLRHFIFMSIFTGLSAVFYTWLNIFVLVNTIPYYYSFIFLLPLYLTHCLEVHYYGHLLSLLVPRLRLINYYMESTLANGDLAKRPDIEEFVSFKNKNSQNSEMAKAMDLYHILINAYDYLMEAIKWQLLVILISSFFCTLSFCYDLSLTIMDNSNSPMDVISNVGMMCMEMLPLFSPCVFGDRVHNEVRKLRELLASRLYENKLDKTGRSTARALLALTEARDLSFSLLRMLQIDVSLPFKFIGLLVTYLIILLQFERVIHPTKPTVGPK